MLRFVQRLIEKDTVVLNLVLNKASVRRWYLSTWAVALLHAVATFVLSATRLYTGKVAIVDLGVFDQAIWTALRYGVPTTTINPPFEAYNWLGFHFSPIVLVMTPIYALSASPELLLALQSALIAGAAVPIFRTCLTILGRPPLAFGWTLLYLINPFVINAAVWDFHEKSFAVFAVALGYLALVEKRRALFLSSMFGLLLCQEHYGIAVAGFGLLWAHTHGDQRTGTATAVAGVAATALILFVLMPALNPGGVHPMLGAESGTPLDRYGWLGLPPGEMIPVLSALTGRAVTYIGLLLVTTGGGPLLAPAFLLPGLADLAANMLSLNPMPTRMGAYHSMVLAPIFIIAAAKGSRNLARHAAVLRFAVAPTLVLTYLALPAPAPGSENIWQLNSIQLRRDPSVEAIQKFLDEDMSVSAQANVGAFFSQRRFIHRFPDKLDEADAVVLRLILPYDPPAHTVFSNPYPPSEMTEVFRMMERVIRDPEFGVVYWNDNWLVALRGAADAVDSEAARRRLRELMSEYENSS